MVTWLRKTFIKDYQNIGDPKVRSAHGVLSAWVGIFLNVILFSLKLASALLLASKAGWVFSMALLGDSLNNLFDFSSSVITLVGFKLSKKPADAKHPFGHERTEYIAGMLIGVAILVSALLLLTRSIQGAIQAEQVDYDVLAFVALGATLPLKGVQSYVNFSLSKTLQSGTLKSVAIDSAIDAFVSSVILLFALLSHFLGWPSFDAYLGCFLAAFLGYNGVNAIREAADSLMGAPMKQDFLREVESIATAHEGVLGVHDILCHNYGADVRFISLHIELDGALSLQEAHQIIDDVEEELAEKLRATVVCHPDPVAVDDERTQAVEAQVKEILSAIDPAITWHDLRLSEEEGKTVLSLDILVPFSSDGALEKRIVDALRVLPLEVAITFDHPFVEK